MFSHFPSSICRLGTTWQLAEKYFTAATMSRPGTITNDLIEAATRIRLKAYVLDTQYEGAFGTDVTLRVLDGFREAGIQPPAERSVDVAAPALSAVETAA